MKKVTAILLISLMLFNMVGYKLLFNYVEARATQRLDQRINAGEYDERMLVEIQIPLNLPYYSDSGYEPYYGETEVNGKHYRYVKRKVSGNTLYLLCLPHFEKNVLVTARTGYMQATTDLPMDQGSKQSKLPSYLKLLFPEYEREICSIDPPTVNTHKINPRAINSHMHSQYEPGCDIQPPDYSPSIVLKTTVA